MSKQCLICNVSYNSEISWYHLFATPKIEANICEKCRKKWCEYEVSENSCHGCGRDISDRQSNYFLRKYSLNEDNYCYDCYHWKIKYPEIELNHVTLYKYTEEIQDWIYRYKYLGDIRLANVITDKIKEYSKQFSDCQWSVLPSTPQTLASRKFHATGEILRQSSINYYDIFDYVGDGIRQASKSKAERMKLNQPFKVNDNFDNVESKLIIFDDIYTTGATMIQAKLAINTYCKMNQRITPDIITISIARNTLSD